MDKLIKEFVDRWYLPEEDDAPEYQIKLDKAEMTRQLEALVQYETEKARIDELRSLPVNYNRPRSSRFVPHKIILERIEELEAQPKKDQGQKNG